MNSPIISVKPVRGSKGKLEVFPQHLFVKNWVFNEDEKDEAALAHYIAAVAEKNGMSANEVYQIFPAMLRMLRSNIDWANPNKITQADLDKANEKGMMSK